MAGKERVHRVADEPSILALYREHDALRAELSNHLRRVTAASGDSSNSRGVTDEAASDVLSRATSHLEGVRAELTRRGVGAAHADAICARASGEGASFALRTAFAAAFPEGRSAPGLSEWIRRARNGSPSAQHVAGMSVLFLASDERTADEGMELVGSAADAGHAGAASAIVWFASDAETAVRLARIAAAGGNPEGCFQLVQLAQRGAAADVTVGEAIELLERAAGAGHAESQLELARVRTTGEPGDGSFDLAQGRRWMERAAAQHRQVAREWLERYGELDASAYLNAVWFDAWTPDSLPPPEPSGRFVKLASAALLVLILVAAVRGSSVGVFVLAGFFAVLMHEAGHWIAARWAGIPIAIFTVGAGPALRSFVVGRGRMPMRVDVRALPLVGWVRPYVAPRGVFAHWSECLRRAKSSAPAPSMPTFDRSEEPESVSQHVDRPRRLVFLTGGLAVNLVAAVAFLWLYEAASPVAPLVTAPVAGRVSEGSIAAAAGIREEDRFLSVGGDAVVGYFDVERRLAPRDASGRGTPTVDPPGAAVAVVVRRAGADVALTWVVPQEPPAKDAAVAYGLRPPESWTVARRPPRSDLEPGDTVLAITAGGATTQAEAPGARSVWRTAIDAGPVDLHVRRGARDVTVLVPRGDPDLVQFDRRREVGPRAGLGDVLAEIGDIGWSATIGLPQTVASALARPATREEQSAFLAAASQDPWRLAHLFGWLHAFLFFLNLLPVPPLDGFQLLVLGVESAIGREVPRRGIAVLRVVGLALLGTWIAIQAFLLVRDAASAAF